ncbi:MAG TPA: hypothetical protein VES01_10935 [Dermatophilaceae bacterium]|nr:hypothetical protein [Dermatophilaceae bacterium]
MPATVARTLIRGLCLLGVVLLPALSGCGGQPRTLDQVTAREALLAETELPSGGWRLVGATQTPPGQAQPRPSLASGACGRALGLLDELEHGSAGYAKGSYAKDGFPLIEVVVQGYSSLPSDLTRLTEIVRGCPSGTLEQDGATVPFTLAPRGYPESGANGARLTVISIDGPRAIDIAVASRGESVVVGTATGPASEAGEREVTTLLDGVVAAQLRKLETTLGS